MIMIMIEENTPKIVICFLFYHLSCWACIWEFVQRTSGLENGWLLNKEGTKYSKTGRLL